MRQTTPDILGALLGNLQQHTLIPIADIRTDGGTQMRAGLNAETVDEYQQWLDDLARKQNGLLEMPALIVYHDGETYWLADGFHRLEAWKRHGSLPTAVQADVRSGTRRDAVLHAAGANANHGLRRTNADKRRAVETLMRDDEWRTMSDGGIAEKCAVSQPFVSNVRRELTQNGFESPTARTGSDGRVINTANIGNTDRPAYAQIWQLQNAVLAYVRGVRPGAVGDQIDLAKTLPWAVGGEEWLSLTDTMPKPWRVGDVKQACNNAVDQLRQEARRNEQAAAPMLSNLAIAAADRDARLAANNRIYAAAAGLLPADTLPGAHAANGDAPVGRSMIDWTDDDWAAASAREQAPTPILRVDADTDADLFRRAEDSHSLDTMMYGKNRIRKPFQYDGKFWIMLSGIFGGPAGSVERIECLRLHPIAENIEPGVGNPHMGGNGYPAGTIVEGHGKQWQLGRQWLFVVRTRPPVAVKALTDTVDDTAGNIAVIDDTAVVDNRVAAIEQLGVALDALGKARGFLPFDSEAFGEVGVLLDDIQRIIGECEAEG